MFSVDVLLMDLMVFVAYVILPYVFFWFVSMGCIVLLIDFIVYYIVVPQFSPFFSVRTPQKKQKGTLCGPQFYSVSENLGFSIFCCPDDNE